MEGRVFVLSAWMCLFLMILSRCGANEQRFLERLDSLEANYQDLKVDFVSRERTLVRKISRAKRSIRRGLKNSLKKQIADALPDVMRSEFVVDLIKSQVISMTSHLEDANRQLKKELNQMETSSTRVEIDNPVDQIGLSDNTDLLTCSDCIESTIMTSKLEVFNDKITELTKQVLHLNSLQREHTGYTYNQSGKATVSQRYVTTSTSISAASHFSSSSPEVSGTSPTTTTTAPSLLQKERNRILVLPYYSKKPVQLQQINIKTKMIASHSNVKFKYVQDLTYVFKVNSLLLLQSIHNRILSFKLDSSTAEILRDNVRVARIAVDEERDWIFLGAKLPGKQIYRMDLNGVQLEVIFNATFTPAFVVVDPRTRTIYTSADDKLLSLSYDGNDVVTLGTGSFTNAATLDIFNGCLYYNKDKDLFRHSISQNTSTKMRSLGFRPLNLRYYRDTIYYSSLFAPGRVESLDLNTNVTHKLQSWGEYNGARICLVP